MTRTISTTPETSGDTPRTTIGFKLDPDRCILSSDGWEFTVDWELEDRWGTCVFDMAFVGGAVQNFAEPQLFGGRTGTVCGVDVERLEPGVGAPVGGG